MTHDIAYLLHRFPENTDTFVKRELRWLMNAGTRVHVISVWKPNLLQTTSANISEWSRHTSYLLPRSSARVAAAAVAIAVGSPGRFLSGVRLAWVTSRPGVHGVTYQLFYFLEAVLAAKEIQRRGYKHLHNHNGDQSGTVAMLAAKLAGISYSITFHGWPVFFDAEYSHIREKVNGAAFTRSISYFCRSQLMMFSSSRDQAPFKIVHCGVNVQEFKFRPPRKHVKRILCVARMSPEKGLIFLIEAFKMLVDSGYKIQLRLVGSGVDQPLLMKMATDLKLDNEVSFLGHCPEAEVRRELENADIFVLPSFVEGVPVSAMEAMAVGVPVIATNVGGTSELIQDGVSGILVRPSDAASICEAIIRLIGDAGLRRKITKFGRQKIEDEFDADKENAKLNGYLLETIKS